MDVLKVVFNAKSEGSVGNVALLLFALSVGGHFKNILPFRNCISEMLNKCSEVE